MEFRNLEEKWTVSLNPENMEKGIKTIFIWAVIQSQISIFNSQITFYFFGFYQNYDNRLWKVFQNAKSSFFMRNIIKSIRDVAYGWEEGSSGSSPPTCSCIRGLHRRSQGDDRCPQLWSMQSTLSITSA